MKINIPSLYRKYVRIIPGVKSYLLAASVVLLLGLSVTVFAWYVDKQRTEEQKMTRVNEQASAVKDDIINRLNIYEQILRGEAGLFKASENVTFSEWKDYINQYDVNNAYPGISGFGYAQYVAAPQLESYINNAKTTLSSDFNVAPPGSRPEYAPITYIQSFSGTQTGALGFDILTSPLRREAAEKARDSGEVIISKALVLLGDTQTKQSGFIMYAPVYKKNTQPKSEQERRDALQGYVFAGYRANDFFSKSIDKASLTAYSGLEVFDGTGIEGNKLLYRSKDFDKYDPEKYSQAYTLKSFGRDWTYRFAGPINNNRSNNQRPNLILIGGITLSTAIAGFLFLVMLTRARAIVYSKQNEAQQAKDDLLSLASHQLRTPATAVKQYLGMILEGYTGKVNKKQLPALQKAYISNERQLDTINQILYVAKADAGRLSINRNNFDINYLVNDIVADLTDTLEGSNQNIKVERSQKKLKVFADEASIRMVVENLISNASKYSHTGSTITLKTGIKNNQVFVEVRDEGVGISPEDYDKLFKKFSRIDNDLSVQVGGSGIGLYIDKVLIELHGGRIDVDSETGKGSIFTIILPKNNANNLTDGGRKNSSL